MRPPCSAPPTGPPPARSSRVPEDPREGPLAPPPLHMRRGSDAARGDTLDGLDLSFPEMDRAKKKELEKVR